MADKRGMKKCPKCGEKAGAPIFRGYPAPECMDELVRGQKDGRVWLGGCCVGENDAKWHCTECGWEWGRR